MARQRDFLLRILSPPQYDDWNDEGESSAMFQGSSELFTATLLLSRACPWILSQRATQTNSILFHCVGDREIPEETICKPRKSNPNCTQQGAAADWWVDTVALLHRMDKNAFVRMMLFNLSASCYIPLKEDRETAASSVLSACENVVVQYVLALGRLEHLVIWIGHHHFYSLNGEQSFKEIVVFPHTQWHTVRSNMANPDHCLCFYTTCLWNESGWVCERGNEGKWYRIHDSGQKEWFSGFAFLSSLLVIHQDPVLSPCRCLPPRLCFIALPWHPLTTISLTLISKTEMHGDIHNTKPPNCLFARRAFSMHARHFSCDQLEWHAMHPIIGDRHTIIHINHPIVIRGCRLMMAPANHEADMMGALGQQSGVAMWRNRRRMFEHVVNRPEMWMTNDQCWRLIKLMSVLFTELRLIESCRSEELGAGIMETFYVTSLHSTFGSTIVGDFTQPVLTYWSVADRLIYE